MQDGSLPPEASVPCLDGIPLSQVGSFLTHDICGPLSMLATYLQSVSHAVTDDVLRAQLADAQSLAREVEGFAQQLRTLAAISAGTLAIDLEPVALDAWLASMETARVGCVRDDRVSVGTDAAVTADRRLLSLAAEGAVWQMARMGAARGAVSFGAVALDGSPSPRVTLGLWRADGALDGTQLHRAAEARDEDWHDFTRRLPACGFPLRIAARVVRAMGGEFEVRRESAQVAVSLPLMRLP